MLTTKELFAELNARRVSSNMKPLKAWKESRAKLEVAVGNLPPPKFRDDVKASTPAPETKVEKTQLAKTKASDKAYAEGITIAKIAADLGMDAKVARAKLRRAGDVDCDAEKRWVFTKEQAAKVKAILEGDKRKK